MNEKKLNLINKKPTDYPQFLIEIKERIHKSRYEAAKTVNQEIIQLYWDIGRLITEKQRTLGWGKSVVETLSEDLQKEFPGITGFGKSNLWSMAQFYSEYHADTILQPLVGEISWSKHLVIMSKCKDMLERQLPHENEAIGIIVCKEKKRTIVEYALKDSKKPIGVATYNLSPTLPDAYKELLPSSEEIAEKLINLRT